MDPQATWSALLEEWKLGNWPIVAELAESLLIWLYKDGFPPDTMPGVPMGKDWNRIAAKSLSEFSLHRARLVLNSPNCVPPGFAFTITCDTCGDEGPDNYDEAIQEGWIGVHFCPQAAPGNYLGRCPDCSGINTTMSA